MDIFSNYLNRYAYPSSYITAAPRNDLQMVVVIPCYNEPDLISSLNALYHCQNTQNSVEVIIVINDAVDENDAIKKLNQETFELASQWAKTHNTTQLCFYIIYAGSLPSKHAGVGLARKIGMDEAVRRFQKIDNENGVIVCFDADSLCLTNYLEAIEKHFNDHPKSPGASIYFEHPLSGSLSKSHYEGIIQYELFLRFYVNALKWAGFPYAHHTVGSSMAVRNNAYQKQGGMNRRKAGEDFYFINKIIPLGHFYSINTTMVIPSARDSTRVPFGTGKAITNWINNHKDLLFTYNPQIFKDLKAWLDITNQLFKIEGEQLDKFINTLPESIREFLIENDYTNHLKSINANCGPHLDQFTKRFYVWFDALLILKFVHFAQKKYYNDVNIIFACHWLLAELNPDYTKNENIDALWLLKSFRKIDRMNR